MTKTAVLLVVAAVCVSAAGSAVFASDQSAQIWVPVAVSDSRGRVIPDLKAADFAISWGDTSPAATGLEVDDRPLSIVIVMDGIEQEDMIDARRALAETLKLIRTSAKGARVGLILGDEGGTPPTLEDAVAATEDHNRRASQMFQTPGSAPGDVLGAAAAALAREEGRRHVVLVMSVNRREAKGVTLTTVVESLKRADVMLASVETGDGMDQSLYLIHGAAGGEHGRVSSVTSFTSAATRLVKAIVSAYRVGFSANVSEDVRLRVTIKDRKNVVLIAPAWAR